MVALAPRGRRTILMLLVALGTGALLWSLPPPASPPVPPPAQPPPEREAAGSAVPPPRQVTRSLAELGLNVRRAGRGLSAHALVFSRAPLAGSELLALLLQRLQASNGFRLVPLPLAGWARTLTVTKQEDLVSFVTETLRKEALPVAFHGHVFFTNFSAFDRQSPTYFNLVRDPVDRAMSRFYYTRTKLSKEGDFVKCVEESWPECDLHKDLSVPYFCGQNRHCMEMNNNWAISQAKNNIEKYFPVVGVLEELNTTFSVLETRIPLFFAGSHPNWNFRKYQILKPDIRKKIGTHFGNENDLYHWIKQRLMKQFEDVQQRTEAPEEAGQDRIAYSIHSKTHLIKQ